MYRVKQISNNIRELNSLDCNCEQFFIDSQDISISFEKTHTKSQSIKNSMQLILDVNNGELIINNNEFCNLQFSDYFASTFNKISEQIYLAKKLCNIKLCEYDPVRNFTEYAYVDLFQAYINNVKKHPDALFVQSAGECLTYKQAYVRVISLRQRLIQSGISENDKVAFLLTRSTWFMITMLAILSLGATYVPIDDKHPNHYATGIIEDADCKVVVVDNNYIIRTRDICNSQTIVNISNLDFLEIDLADLDKWPKFSKRLVACILFTSGSTGKPKGVCITRDGIANLSRWLADYAKLMPGDIFGMSQSAGFSAHIEVMFSSLFAGSAIDILPEEYRYEPQKINDYINANNITCIKMASPLGREFIKSVRDTHLRFLLLSGAQLGRVDTDRSYRIVDEYGSTENTAQASAIDVADKSLSESIGFPIWNTELLVLDKHLRILPPYCKGYLHSAGRGVSDGYLNNEVLTKKVFIPNPYYDSWPYERLYNTGDCAYQLPNKEVCYIGRDDSQVKIRGNRIELSEVENCIRNHKSIEEVAVIAIKKKDDYELVAYVQSNLDTQQTEKIVKNQILKYKPKYMVPSFVLKLDKIPLNVYGKIDKKHLPSIDTRLALVDYVQPVSEKEKLICSVFKEVLEVEHLGINDDFVRLGGDSLSAIEAVGKLESIGITLTDIINNRTPAKILENLDNDNNNRKQNDVLKLTEQKFDNCLTNFENSGILSCPLTNAQYNIYIVEKLGSNNNSFNQAIYTQVAGDVGIKDVRNAVNFLAEHYPIIKSRIIAEKSVPMLVCDSNLPIDPIHVSYVDDKLMTEISSRMIDFSINMGRVIFIQCDKKNYVLFVLHHIITDYISNDILLTAFKNAINKSLNRKPDFGFVYQSCYDSAYKQVFAVNPANKQFEDLLSGTEIEASTKLEYDTFTKNNDEYIKKTIIKADFDSNQLKDFCRMHGITIGSYLTVAFGYCLSRFCFNKKIEFSILDFGRHVDQVKDSIGYFVKTIPFVCDCSENSTIRFLQKNSTTYFNCLQNYEASFQDIAKQYNLKHDIEFTYNTSRIATNRKEFSEQLKINNFHKLTPSSYLVITAFNEADTICVSGEFSSKYSDEFVKRFMFAYKQIINSMLCVGELSDISYVMKSDIEMLNMINKTNTKLNFYDVIDGLRYHVANSADNNLVVYENKIFTYSLSACIINRIQNLIKKHCLYSQSVIAVLVSRSHWYFFCAIAALCYDCVYVPIDDSYPDDRIAFMLQDSSADAIFVTNSTKDRAIKLNNNAKTNLHIIDVTGVDTNLIPINKLYTLDYHQHDSACILYTSGSTGKPKGNIFTRMSLINLNEWYIKHSHITSSSVYAQYSSFVFDMHTYAFFSVILVGASVTIVPTRVRLNMSALYEYFADKGVTHTAIPTQVGKLFLQAGVPDCVQRFAVAGEALGEINHNKFNFVLEDFYGPTESNVVTGCMVKDKIISSSIGWFVDNVAGYILDDNKNLVPIGAAGELYLTGKQLVKGYLNRPDQNKACFIKNPFNFDNNPDRQIMYKTGDVVRFLPDNSIEFLGRADSQVKIRGNRIELSEVESCIREIDCINDATVQAFTHNSNKELAAYVVLNNKLNYALKTDSNKNTDLNLVYPKRIDYNKDTLQCLFDEADDIQELLADIDCDGVSSLKKDLSINVSKLSVFCNNNVSIKEYLAGAFVFAISRFIYSDKVLLGILNEDDNSNICSLVAECKDNTISNYLVLLNKRIKESLTLNINQYSKLTEKLGNKVPFVFVYSEGHASKINNFFCDLSFVVEHLDNVLTVKITSTKSSVSTLNSLFIAFSKSVEQMQKVNVLSEIDYLDNNQRKFISKWNNTTTKIIDSDIINLFNCNVENLRNKLFVADEIFNLTYGQSAAIINFLIDKLKTKKINRNSNVAIFVKRSVWYVLCALGILANDCTYVPIEESYPDDRVKFMLEDTSASAIFVDSATKKRIIKITEELFDAPQIIEVSQLSNAFDATSNLKFVKNRSNEIACILYTSGTTGKPKGSLIRNRSIINFACWMKEISKISLGDRFAMHSSFVFDAHFIAFYPTLLAGGSIHIVPVDTKGNLVSLSKYFNDNLITHTFLTAQVAKTFIELSEVSAIRCLITGGEVVGKINKDLSYTVIDAYGPTECCVATNAIDVSKKIDGSSIGHFKANCKGFILDKNKKLAPIGAVGELYLSGVQTTKGYLNRPEANKAAFIINNFESDNNSRILYKTSDLVRYLPDGTIGYIGREDSQVKIRGNRVELSEVEIAIREIDDVKDVVALTVKSGTNNVLVAYVVVDNKICCNNIEKRIKDYLSSSKPDYMVPTFIELIDRIPLNVNGKIDKHSLPFPNVGTVMATYVAPTSKLQKSVCESFQKCLNIKKIGINDDFIELGGDSLAAINFLANLNKGLRHPLW